MDICSPTNTVSLSNFDVLKFDAVEDPLIDVTKLTTVDFEESYFATTVNFIMENRNEYTKAKMTLYKSISEATSERVVLESFSDFFVKIKEIIDKFLKFLKSLAARFLTSLNKLIESESYLKKHKKDFSDFKDADKFDITGYKFTFTDNIPVPNAILDFNRDMFIDLLGDQNKINASGVQSTNVYLAANLENKCNEFRKNIIGADNDISISDFPDELFKVYRNGDSDTDTIEIDRLYVKNAVDRFFSYSTIKKSIDSQCKQVNDAYKRVEAQVKDIVKRNGDLNKEAFKTNMQKATDITAVSVDGEGIMMSGDLMMQLDIYVKTKVDEIQKCSDIHALAFSAKLDALKDCYRQDKATLYTALSRIQRTDAKRKDG